LLAHFKDKPDGRLRVEIFERSQAYLTAIKSAGAKTTGTAIKDLSESGGIYLSSTKTLYVNYEPYAERNKTFWRDYGVMLHEATHQFHDLVCRKRGARLPDALWFVEGLAEFFEIYRWDGRALQTGMMPIMDDQRRAARTLKVLEDCQWDIDGIITGARAPNPEFYAVWWMLVQFLARDNTIKFNELAALLNHGTDTAEAWKKVYGPLDQRFVQRFRSWVQRSQTPWVCASGMWMEIGGWIKGAPPEPVEDRVALVVLNSAVQNFSAQVRVDTKDAWAGLVFGCKNQNRDFYALLVSHDGTEARVSKIIGGKAEVLETRKISKTGGLNALALLRNGNTVTLFANNKEITKLQGIDGGVGLFSWSGRAWFHNLQFTAAAPSK
jgi:hypothetical protein